MTGPAPDDVSRETLHGLGVSRETLDRLQTFVGLLLRWNQRINLISRADEAAVWRRHVVDSAQLLAFLPPGLERGDGSAVDLGAGGGFPGLILSIVGGIRYTLVESDHRKAAFLREASRALAAPVTVHATRAEALSVEPFALLTARAFAALNAILAMGAHLVRSDGAFLLLKGATADQELTAAAATWNMQVERFASRTDPAASILRLTQVSRRGCSDCT